MDNPLSLNRYTHVLNNPLKYVDPTGHINEIGGGIVTWQGALNRGLRSFTNINNYKPAYNALSTSAIYVPLTTELLGPEAFDVLTDGKWGVVDDGKAAISMAAEIITFDALIQALKSGNINPKDRPAIRIFEAEGKIYSLDIDDYPNEAYEVEFVDDEGKTKAQIVLLPHQIELFNS